MTRARALWRPVAVLLMAAPASAANLEFVNCPSSPSQLCVSGIQDVVVDGAAYNVDFLTGTFDAFLEQGLFPFFGDQARTEAARDAINALLNPTNVQLLDYGGASQHSYYALPFAQLEESDLGGFARVAVGTCIPETPSEPNCWGQRDYARFVSPTLEYQYAILSPVAVPVPAAGALFLAALGVLTATVRKRVA